jgi:hypothetical protein
MGERPDGNRSVIGRHTAKLVAGDQRCPCAQVGSTKRGQHTRRSGANNDDV